jgi:hypothetical protein
MYAMRFVLVSALLSTLIGCLSSDGGGDAVIGTLDLSGVGTARFNEEYVGQVAVTNYDGPARFTLNGGALPEGLDMNAAGRVTGTALYVADGTVEVLVGDMDGIEDFVGNMTIGVTAEYVEDAFLGYDHDQLNNMYEHPSRRYMGNIWMRITEVGIDDMSEWTMNPGLYTPGPNGQVEDGLGDDVRIGDVAFTDLEWEFENWEATEETDIDIPAGYPSQHLPEGDDPTVSDEGVFTAGVDGGEGDFTAEHPDFPNVIVRKVQVVPPDWCPNGEHDGANSPGQCS